MRNDFKLSESEKLTLIEDLIEDVIHCKEGLQVVRSDDTLQGRTPSKTVHIYQVLGTQNNRRTQTSNLIQKVEEIHRTKESLPQPESEMIDEKQHPFFRYFKNNIQCFRCKKEGHHNYACLQESQCLYCLSSQHHSERCPQRTICYQCYRFGHVVNDCREQHGSFCSECKRKHTKTCCFLTKGTEPIKQMFTTDYLYHHKDIRCMKCHQLGHISCNRDEKE